MNKTSLETIIAYIGVIIILALMGVATYAYFGLEIEGEGKDMTIQTFNKNMEITYTDTSNVTLVNAYTGESISKTFTVKNTGDVDVYYNVVLENVVNNFEVPDELVYTITETGGNASRTQTTIPTTDSTLLSDIKITAGDTHYYVMQIKFLEKDTDQSYNMNKTFSSNINIVPSSNSGSLKNLSADTLSYKLVNVAKSAIFVPPSNELMLLKSFGFGNAMVPKMTFLGRDTSGDTSDDKSNGKLMYTNSTDDGKRIYFFTGGSVDNNVLFAGFCWKIIRTTDNGSVKMIYNGVPTDGACTDATGSSATIGNSTFNSSSNYNAYVGYMYGTPNSSGYSDEHKNVNNSTIKSMLDNWYAENLINYNDYIEDTEYCNNRVLTEFKSNGVEYSKKGYSNLNSGYDSVIKGYNFSCEKNNDKLSVKNNSLTYPIGLIDASEALMGSITRSMIRDVDFTKEMSSNKSINDYSVEKLSSGLKINKASFLSTSDKYWTMSPAYFNGTSAYNFLVDGTNENAISVNTSAGVRPVIAIKNTVKLLSGDGSLSSPYKLTN